MGGRDYALTLCRPFQFGGHLFEHLPIAGQDSVDNIDSGQRVSLIAVAASTGQDEI